ncbi:MAG: hypothetical protein A3J38_07315 [Gammaproteobacteria bacterium RIFCSPHIGHO2_12_FULL_45_9]|nr:MAG: hypothetical protein A3J38_07315 [Gammaproteobacteria bacterium RIFCSPHIGHO2_12_FULL_45_9]
MEIKVLENAQELPTLAQLLLEDKLKPDEKSQMVFGETSDGKVYCLIYKNASTQTKSRAATIRAFSFPNKTVSLLYTTQEIIQIIRDAAHELEEINLTSDTDLEKKFTAILVDSLKAGASDIHFEVYPNMADIKLRINGMLFTVSQMDSKTINRLINYMYNVAATEGSKDTQFNIEEMQDALLDRQVEVDGVRKHIKIRLQTAPCYPNSISIVMRLLRIENQLSSTLSSLGYTPPQIKTLQRAQMKPTGATIIAGTTGSGKSTTLATLLSEIHVNSRGSKKILTAEDPPEFAIPGANQINLSNKRQEMEGDEDMFVKAIKVAMRCDPDVIMVGEVRDKQSSQLLSSAVLSGHQVFTTIHASSALSIVDRLYNLGFDLYIMTSPNFLSLLIYQTLLPILCQKCCINAKTFFAKNKTAPVEALKERLTLLCEHDETAWDHIRFSSEVGCDHCRMGYTGRTVAAEMIEPDTTMLNYFRNNQLAQASQYWKDTGGRTVLDNAIEKMVMGNVDPRSVEDRCGLIQLTQKRSE